MRGDRQNCMPSLVVSVFGTADKMGVAVMILEQQQQTTIHEQYLFKWVFYKFNKATNV